MQYGWTLQVPTMVSNIICASITLRVQGCTWSAMWSLENKLFVRGSVVLTWLGEYTHTQERFFLRWPYGRAANLDMQDGQKLSGCPPIGLDLVYLSSFSPSLRKV